MKRGRERAQPQHHHEGQGKLDRTETRSFFVKPCYSFVVNVNDYFPNIVLIFWYFFFLDFSVEEEAHEEVEEEAPKDETAIQVVLLLINRCRFVF